MRIFVKIYFNDSITYRCICFNDGREYCCTYIGLFGLNEMGLKPWLKPTKKFLVNLVLLFFFNNILRSNWSIHQ